MKLGSKELLNRCIDNWGSIKIDDPTIYRMELYKNLDKYFDLYSAIVYLCDVIPVKSYLEIGVRNCASLIHAIKAKSVEKVVGIDLWLGNYAGLPNTYEFALEQIKNFKKDITLIKGNSIKEVKKIKDKFNLITIDGAHDVKGLKTDIDNCLSLLNSKAAIIIDDINHPLHRDELLPFVRSLYSKINFEHLENLQGNGTAIFYRGFEIESFLGK